MTHYCTIPINRSIVAPFYALYGAKILVRDPHMCFNAGLWRKCH
nr:MAG TPA: hypothetical protein [Caudoviricetes sp.]